MTWTEIILWQSNIRRAANHAVYQPDRTSFGTMHLDVMVKCEGSCKCLMLTFVIETSARQSRLYGAVKRFWARGEGAVAGESGEENLLQCPKCLQARCMCTTLFAVPYISLTLNILQIRDSLFGPSQRSLAQFTFHTANKYQPGLYEQGKAGLGYTIHNVILVSQTSPLLTFIQLNNVLSDVLGLTILHSSRSTTPWRMMKNLATARFRREPSGAGPRLVEYLKAKTSGGG